MNSVQQTFLEFWPEALLAYAVPHVAIALSDAEMSAIRRCHRLGKDTTDALENLATRASIAADSRPFFMRMGYGSWAASQMAKFGTLRIENAQEAHDVLALRDLRLAEINRRWGHGFPQKLFVRAYLPPESRAEIRVLVSGRKVIGAWHRHVPTQPAPAPDLAFSIAGLMAEETACYIDCMFAQGRWYLSDINPAQRANPEPQRA